LPFSETVRSDSRNENENLNNSKTEKEFNHVEEKKNPNSETNLKNISAPEKLAETTVLPPLQFSTSYTICIVSKANVPKTETAKKLILD